MAPGALRGRHDRRKGRKRSKTAGVFEADSQCAMTAHRMAHDGGARGIHLRAGLCHHLGQLCQHIVIHVVVRRPGVLGRIEVKAGAQTHVIAAIGVVGDFIAPRTGIWRNDGNTQLCSMPLCAGFRHEILIRAGQPRQVIHHGYGPFSRLRRQVHRINHVAVEHLRAVLKAMLLAPK